ncbi:hypothetical protein Y032_0020g106 [Ancylostoma ceylanicum]|uniref:Uncharacterized protein n=1 Tax=Ancylostoma ceylanicum TaxID=53326 RepID=A0A016V0S2_9BILA|nr:hypothetical protein Y032_0020g106 [Ancylostoma ceylanicum]
MWVNVNVSELSKICLQVSARGYSPEKRDYHHHFVYDGDITWGTDGNVVTRLFNTQGVEVSNFEVRAK